MSAVRHKRICAVRPCHIVLVALAISLGGSLSGCAALQVSSSPDVDSDLRVRALQRELKRKQAQIDELKERNLVLEKQRKRKAPQERRSLVVQADVGSVAVTPTPVAVESVGTAQTGEHFLYSKILETYRSKNFSELQKTLQLLLKTYPDSVFADNALYLAGLMAFEKNDLEIAARYMDQILAEYPRGNKVVTALYTKAVIEKRRNKPGSAKDLFLRVRSLYPGSPEAARVSIELKLLESAAGARRES